MAKKFYGSINVMAIDKSKLVNGKKGKYLPIIVWENEEPDQFGNHMSIQIEMTKEERDNKKKAVYLGNLKLSEGVSAAKSSNSQSDDDDLPF